MTHTFALYVVKSYLSLWDQPNPADHRIFPLPNLTKIMQTKPISCVWVVDDDPLQVLILNRLLGAHQAVGKTKFFSGAKSAIENLGSKLKPEEQPELIFLDLIMMRGDGWDFLEFYKKSKSKLVRQANIVVISSPNEENLKKLKQYPDVTEFLSKPIDKKEFEDLMANMLKKV
jgi:CheY-like chemotaxis protein